MAEQHKKHSGSGTKSSPIAIAQVLRGIDFPADKQKLERFVEENQKKTESAGGILDMIRRLPDRQYHNMAEVEKGLGEVERFGTSH